jgi:hypothetical protein
LYKYDKIELGYLIWKGEVLDYDEDLSKVLLETTTGAVVLQFVGGMQIVVEDSNEPRKFILNVEPGDTIHSVTRQIQAILGGSGYVLTHFGRVLSEGETVDSCNLKMFDLLSSHAPTRIEQCTQPTAISLQPDAPMSMVGGAGTHVDEWSAFAKFRQPVGRDSELYHAWYALACQDYNEAWAHLQTSQASTRKEMSPSDKSTIQMAVSMMTDLVKKKRAAAVYIMSSRESASTEKFMQETLCKYVLKNCHTPITESKGSQLGGPEELLRTADGGRCG